MGCPCHGKSGFEAKNITAFDQCLYCAKKHLITAWSLWNEHNYQDLNLEAIAGQLRLTVQHSMYIEKDIADKVRDLSLKIEKRELTEVTEKAFEEVILELQNKIYAEFPEMKKRFDDFKATLSK